MTIAFPIFPLYNLSMTIAQFISRIEKTETCWFWQGAKTKEGYGSLVLHVNGTKIAVGSHRLSYEIYIGKIPKGKVLDHLCRNTGCVNPKHLEPVIQRVNILRSPLAPPSLNAKKTHCINGHEYTESNTLHRQRPNRMPERSCRTCRNKRNAARIKKMKNSIK